MALCALCALCRSQAPLPQGSFVTTSFPCLFCAVVVCCPHAVVCWLADKSWLVYMWLFGDACLARLDQCHLEAAGKRQGVHYLGEWQCVYSMPPTHTPLLSYMLSVTVTWIWHEGTYRAAFKRG